MTLPRPPLGKPSLSQACVTSPATHPEKEAAMKPFALTAAATLALGALALLLLQEQRKR